MYNGESITVVIEHFILHNHMDIFLKLVRLSSLYIFCICGSNAFVIIYNFFFLDQTYFVFSHSQFSPGL